MNQASVKTILSLIAAGAIILVAVISSGNNVNNVPNTAAPALAGAVQNSAENLPVSDFKEKISDGEVIVIDVRTPEEYESGHLKGALNLDFYDSAFPTNLEKLDKTKRYAIYCRSGNRSGKALQMMKERGIRDAVDLQGGLTAWLSADMDIECSGEKICLKN